MPALLAEVFGVSRSDARRLIGQGGVRVGDRVLEPDEQELPAEALDGQVLRVGKRRFARLRRS